MVAAVRAPADLSATFSDFCATLMVSNKLSLTASCHAELDIQPLYIGDARKMDERLREIAEVHYQQKEFLQTLFELAVENQWFDVQHMVQHDMAKAVIADYSLEQGMGYLNQQLFLDNWEQVIDVGWNAFCNHTGLSRERVMKQLQKLGNNM